MPSAPTAPQLAVDVFGPRLPLAQRYADLLATDGITRGLLGPREADRIWARHLLNCAAVTELLPVAARVVDVGSGAGLPGLVVAIRRPDLSVELVEPLLRRATFLSEVVETLGLGAQVRVVRGRAEEQAVRAQLGGAPWVTARAVAPLDRLVRWCLPLLAPGGQLLALKGDGAAGELLAHRDVIARLGGANGRLVRCSAAGGAEPTNVVVIERGLSAGRTKGKS